MANVTHLIMLDMFKGERVALCDGNYVVNAPLPGNMLPICPACEAKTRAGSEEPSE